MWKCLKDRLQSSKTTLRYVWSNEQPNLTLMCTIDNRTPLVFAVCHPEITKEIIQDLLNFMTNDSKDLDQNQIFITIGQVAKQSLNSYDILTPVLDACNSHTFNQLLHFSCRYNNYNLLKWLIQPPSEVNNQRKSRVWIPKDLDLNVKDHAGYTPLLTAAFYSSTECVDYLLMVSRISKCFCNHQFYFLVRKC
jgi:ankyrin repeat protein